MSQKIRIGNDIAIRWSLLDEDEQPYIMTGRDVSIELNVGTKKVRIKEFTTEDNTLIFTYYGKDQRHTGSYILKFIENDGEKEMVTFDIKDAFTLVEHSWLAVDEGETPETVQLEFVTITSTLLERIGPSAGFGIIDAEADNNVGTPSVDVQTSGPNTAKNIHFTFHNIKGEPGDDAQVTRANIEAALNESPGKNLSTEDYTTAEKSKLRNIEEGAQVNPTIDPTPTAMSDNPVSSGGVSAAIADFITRTVNDLANYYLKSETYTKAEVQSLILSIHQFHYEIYASLSDITIPSNNVLYLIGPTGSGSDKYEEYVYNTALEQPQFVKIGDTSIDLSGYVTIDALNAALLAKQDKLIGSGAGQNIKTINSNSILGAGDIDTTEVFYATYGVTSFAEISAAVSAGKVVICKNGNDELWLTSKNNIRAIFVAITSAPDIMGDYARCNSADVWTSDSFDVSDTYYAAYGSAQYQDVLYHANDLNQIVYSLYENRVSILTDKGNPYDETMVFTTIVGSEIKKLTLAADNTWGNSVTLLAERDGHYKQLIAGQAEDLVGSKIFEAKYGGMRPSGDTESVGSGVAVIRKIRGQVVKKNQIYKISDESASVTEDGLTLVDNRDNTYTFSFNPTGSSKTVQLGSFEAVAGHRYALSVSCNKSSVASYYVYTDNMVNYVYLSDNRIVDIGGTMTAETAGNIGVYLSLFPMQGEDYTIAVNVYDVTDMFGDIAVSNDDIIEAMPLDNYPFNEGTPVFLKKFGVLTRGFNRYDHSTGKAYLPGNYTGDALTSKYEICGDYTALSYEPMPGFPINISVTDGLFSFSNVGQVSVQGGNAVNTLIHLVWSGHRNYGEEGYAYEPYWESRLAIDFTTLKGKAAGDSDSETICPDGLAKVGNTADEFVASRLSQRIVKRIGKRAYQSGDENDSTVLTDGTNTFYVLATPVEYTLDDKLDVDYRVDDYGTEEPAEVMTAEYQPRVCDYDVQYTMNAPDTLREVSQNAVRKSQIKQEVGNSTEDVLSQKAVNDNYARKSGVEIGLVAGAAQALSTGEVKESQFFTLSNSIKTGKLKIKEIRGVSMLWTQYRPELTFTSDTDFISGVKFTNLGDNTVKMEVAEGGATGLRGKSIVPTIRGYKNHKILIMGCPPGGANNTYHLHLRNTLTYETGEGLIITIDNNASPYYLLLDVEAYVGCPAGTYIFEPNVFDLTDIFGSGNEPTIAEFKALLKFATYAYNTGSLISNKTTSIKGYAGNTLKVTLPLDLTSLTGKLNGEGDSVTIFPKGMRSVKKVYDVLLVEEDGWARQAIKKIGDKDLGVDLTWTKSANYNVFSATIADAKSTYSSVDDAICEDFRFVVQGYMPSDSNMPDGMASLGGRNIKIKPSETYADAQAFAVAMRGVEVQYILANYATYILDTPIQVSLPIENGEDSFVQLPETTNNPTVAPMSMSYMQVVDAITRLEELEDEVRDAKEFFWATYGVTTADEIDAAVAAGKVVMCSYGNNVYLLTYVQPNGILGFSAVYSTSNRYLQCRRAQEDWIASSYTQEQASQKLISLDAIITNRESTTKYTSAKATFDGLGKYGVVSQTQTWSGTGSQPRTYVMSDLVYGLIPQANIDLFVSAGATFNETTGYFELNGLADISYQEMKAIYAAGKLYFSANHYCRYAGNQDIRTILPIESNIQPGSMPTSTMTSMFLADSKIEVIKFIYDGKPISCGSMNYTFANSYCLKKIDGVQLSSTISAQELTSAFSGCYSLEELVLNRVGKDLSLADSSLLNLASIVNIVDTAINTSAITITLHADAYARCQADTTEYTYNEQTYTGILAYASARDITIASA